MDKKITENILDVEGEDSLIKPDSASHAMQLYNNNMLYYRDLDYPNENWWTNAKDVDFGKSQDEILKNFEYYLNYLGYFSNNP